MSYPYAAKVLTQFGKAARHAAAVIGYTYAEPPRIETADDMLAFSSGPLTPFTIARQFAERSQPVLELTAADMTSPETAASLAKLQDMLRTALLPAFNLAETEWESLFPKGVNVVDNVLRLLDNYRTVETDLMVVDTIMRSAHTLLIEQIEPGATRLAAELKAQPF